MPDSISLALGNEQLAEHATAIRALGKRVAHGVIEIGDRLIAAKEICGHGNWLPWLEREFKWSDQTARRFIQVAEAAKFNNLEDLNIDISALYLLTAPSTPLEVVENVIALHQGGQRIRRIDVVHAIRGGGPITITQHPTLRSWPTVAASANRCETEVSTLTSADLRKARIRPMADDLLRSLDAALAMRREIVAVLTEAERRRLREGLDMFSADLDDSAET